MGLPLEVSADLGSPVAAVILVGTLGLAGSATVAPLQTWVPSQAGSGDQSPASSFGIVALDLGSADGAWTGGLVTDHGPGLAAGPLGAAAFPAARIGVDAVAAAIGRRSGKAPSDGSSTEGGRRGP